MTSLKPAFKAFVSVSFFLISFALLGIRNSFLINVFEFIALGLGS